MNRRVAFTALRRITADNGYANLVLAAELNRANLNQHDAAFVTELVAGTTRGMGVYDLIIEVAANRRLTSLQPAVIDLLRLGTHQILNMNVPNRAAVATTVDLARSTVGQRVTGLVNAVLRKIARQELEAWLDEITRNTSGINELAIRQFHPAWIAKAYADVLPADELRDALSANNRAPRPTLVIRPTLMQRDALGSPTPYSPFGAYAPGNPQRNPHVAAGRAGVQDEGSQLVAWALASVDAPSGPWLDACAGPGGKAALLAGLALERGEQLIASEFQEHRAHLVERALTGYRQANIVVADACRPAWKSGAFARVMADVPCSGLGALRRRPEARWRKQPSDIDSLVALQRTIASRAIDAAMPGGVIAYVTCSPHRDETEQVVRDVADERVEILHAASALPNVPHAAAGPFVQLWPHRHGTDAMFLALLRRR